MRHPEHEEKQVGEVFPPVEVKKHGHAQSKAFTADTAERTGQSKRSINEHISRADALGDDLQAITGWRIEVRNGWPNRPQRSGNLGRLSPICHLATDPTKNGHCSD